MRTVLVLSAALLLVPAITSHGLWRGLGDAYSAGVWQFDQGQFILKRYEVDAQYDGEARAKTIARFE